MKDANMSSTKAQTESSSKQDESMQQAPTAPPPPPDPNSEPTMGPPPSYSEAISTPSYPPMQSPTPYPTSTPYPIVQTSTMPLPSANQPPYPVGDSHIPNPMQSPMSGYDVVHHTQQQQQQPIGFSDLSTAVTTAPSHSYQNPIVNQPPSGLAFANEQYLHPKTYVVLQDERQRNEDDCTCTDWLMCCWCCVETCRCLMLCLECFAAFK